MLCFGHIPVDLCGYDYLLLHHHRRSAPPCEKGGEGGVSRLLLRRHHIAVREARICGVSGREGGRAVYVYWEIIAIFCSIKVEEIYADDSQEQLVNLLNDLLAAY